MTVEHADDRRSRSVRGRKARPAGDVARGWAGALDAATATPAVRGSNAAESVLLPDGGGEDASVDGELPPPDDVTLFQINCLRAISTLDSRGETSYGLGIKTLLNEWYAEEVTHAQLYPNLDKLAEAGLVEKGTVDRRTNSYEMTPLGRELVLRHLHDVAEAVGASVDDP